MPAKRRKNESVAMGFYDRSGRFHPIRASDDYDPEAVGEGRQYARAKKRKKTVAKKRKNPPRNSIRLSNFTGVVTRGRGGKVTVRGTQRKKK